MFPLVHTAMTLLRRGASIHKHYKAPHKHKAAIAGHLLEVAAVAAHAVDWWPVEVTAGLIGASLLLFHVVTTEV